MSETLILTFIVGGGLLLCGYSIGYVRGLKQGTYETTAELFRSGLITPEKILTHYSNAGNEKARDMLTQINALKREQANKEKNND